MINMAEWERAAWIGIWSKVVIEYANSSMVAGYKETHPFWSTLFRENAAWDAYRDQ